jgi:hypothetical protein
LDGDGIREFFNGGVGDVDFVIFRFPIFCDSAWEPLIFRGYGVVEMPRFIVLTIEMAQMPPDLVKKPRIRLRWGGVIIKLCPLLERKNGIWLKFVS